MTSRSLFPRPGQLRNSDCFILFSGERLVVRGDNFLWRRAEITRFIDNRCALLTVEHTDERRVVALANPAEIDSAGLETRSLRSLLLSSGDLPFALAGKASQLLEWYRSHRHCGVCGALTRPHPQERALCCPNCERHFYPRINPCVIVLVTKGRQLLLARSNRFRAGFFSCLAGFVEAGESAEEAIHREVREEAGIEVENLRYFSSQPWPFPSQLMLGYLADYKSGTLVPEPGEIEAAGWYGPDELPQVPPPGISVAGDLIEHAIQRIKHRRF